MTNKEQKEWRDSMAEALYPTLKEKFWNEFKKEIAREVALNVDKWMDLPLTVKQVAQILGVKKQTIYKWQERDVLTFQNTGKKQFTITLKSLNIQLSRQKHLTLDVSDNHNKPSSTLSRDPVEAANLEQ